MNNRILQEHLIELSLACSIEASEDLHLVKIKDVCLPPGWNRPSTAVLIEIPRDYPLSAPGQGSNKLYLEQGLRFYGKIPRDYSESSKRKGWAWWCYEEIQWDPKHDNLINLVEMLRTDLTDPD